MGTRRTGRHSRRAAEIADYADRTWIVNSRNTADEDAVRTLASLAGFVPRIAHEIDSLELVEDLIIAGYGVGLLPIGRPTTAGVKVVPLAELKAILTAYAGLAKADDMAPAADSAGPNAPTSRCRTPPPAMAPPSPRALTESTVKCSGYQSFWPRTKSASTMDYRHNCPSDTSCHSCRQGRRSRSGPTLRYHPPQAMA